MGDGRASFAADPAVTPTKAMAAEARWLAKGDPMVTRIAIEREGHAYMSNANGPPLPSPIPAKPKTSPRPVKKPAKKPGRKRSVKSGAVKMKRSRGECEHPKAKRQNLGYAIRCGECGHVI